MAITVDERPMSSRIDTSISGLIEMQDSSLKDLSQEVDRLEKALTAVSKPTVVMLKEDPRKEPIDEVKEQQQSAHVCSMRELNQKIERLSHRINDLFINLQV